MKGYNYRNTALFVQQTFSENVIKILSYCHNPNKVKNYTYMLKYYYDITSKRKFVSFNH